MDYFLKECMDKAKPLGLDLTSRKGRNNEGIGKEINWLVNQYIKAEKENDTRMIDMIVAALYVRFYKSMQNFYKKIQTTSASQEVSQSDLPSIFFARFDYVLKYIKKKQDAGEEVNCQQFINRSIQTEVENLAHKYGLWKKCMANGKCISMNTSVGTDKDGNEKTIEDVLVDDASCPTALGTGITVEMYIKDYFTKKKYDMAIIISAISYGQSVSFTQGAVRKFINSLTDRDIEFYEKTFNVDRDILTKTIKTLQKYKPGQLDQSIKLTLSELRNSMDIRALA